MRICSATVIVFTPRAAPRAAADYAAKRCQRRRVAAIARRRRRGYAAPDAADAACRDVGDVYAAMFAVLRRRDAAPLMHRPRCRFVSAMPQRKTMRLRDAAPPRERRSQPRYDVRREHHQPLPRAPCCALRRDAAMPICFRATSAAECRRLPIAPQNEFMRSDAADLRAAARYDAVYVCSAPPFAE